MASGDAPMLAVWRHFNASEQIRWMGAPPERDLSPQRVLTSISLDPPIWLYLACISMHARYTRDTTRFLDLNRSNIYLAEVKVLAICYYPAIGDVLRRFRGRSVCLAAYTPTTGLNSAYSAGGISIKVRTSASPAASRS